MWDTAKLASWREESARRIVVYAMAALAAAFLWVLIIAPKTYAADATWSGATTITYNANAYNGPADDNTVKGLKLPTGDQAFTYTDPALDMAQPSTDSADTVTPSVISSTGKIHVIFFNPGTDISTATTAQYETLDYLGPNSYANPSKPIQISIDKRSETASSGTSSCAVSGLGWILCPVTNWIASGMDYVFGILSGFLVVQPSSTNTNSALFTAWTWMRSFANVAFVIGFLIIIYSQLTNFGISNYGIKKLLPRLIIAALLVNLSYYICAAAVDISNVLGYSIEGVFVAIRNSLLSTQGTGFNGLTFANVAGFVLSGGTAAVITGLTIVSNGGIVASLFLLLPMLVSGLMALLVALLVMAGRQALITILIIISPLAFVAYLLPNTEKWFEKWRSTFITMLIIFPGFSIIFGGSQLASEAIMRNANSINLVILGMFVKVAPLFITPLLLKMSGSMLNTLAGFVSAPNKAISAAAKALGEDYSSTRKARWLANDRPTRWFTPQRYARGLGKRSDHAKRHREYQRTAYGAHTDSRYRNSRDFSNIDQVARRAADSKGVGEGQSELRYNRSKLVAGTNQTLDTQLRAVTDQNTDAKTTAESTYEVGKTDAFQQSGPPWTRQSADMQQALDDARISTRNIAIQGIRKQSAQGVQQKELAQDLKQHLEIREIAGAKEIDEYGATRAEAAAISAIYKSDSEVVTNQVTLLGTHAEQNNMTVKDYTASVARDIISGTPNTDSNLLEAVFESQALEGNISLLENARGSLNVDQDVLSRVLARNAGKMKEKGGFHLQADPTLNIIDQGANFTDVMNKNRLGSLGGTTATGIKDLKYGWVKDMATRLATNDEGILTNALTDPDPASRAALQSMYDNFHLALTDDDILGTIGDRIPEVQQIEETLRNAGFTDTVPRP